MPANNRMHTGAALQTHGIWADTIGYDPYAPTATGTGEAPVPESLPVAPSPYEKAQGLLALARLTGSGTSNSRGTCYKCNGGTPPPPPDACRACASLRVVLCRANRCGPHTQFSLHVLWWCSGASHVPVPQLGQAEPQQR